MRDPSDGGYGTHVLNSFLSASNAMDWTVYSDSNRCGGRVNSFCPGGIISQDYQGADIVTICNYGASGGCNSPPDDCIRAIPPYWKGVIGACDSGPTDLGGNGEISSAFVLQSPCSNGQHICFVSIKYGLDNGAINWLTSYVNQDLDLYVGNNGLYSNWTEFGS